MGTAITGTQTRTLKASVVTELPDKGVSNKIYYVPNGTTGDNKYDEYIWIKDAEHPNGYFEKVGQKDIDLNIDNLPIKENISGTEKIVISDNNENKGIEISKVKEYATEGVATKEDLNGFIPNLRKSTHADQYSSYFPYCFFNDELSKISLEDLCKQIWGNEYDLDFKCGKAFLKAYYGETESSPVYIPEGIKFFNQREWTDIEANPFNQHLIFNSDIECNNIYTSSLHSNEDGVTTSSVFNAVGSITEVYNKTEVDEKLSAKADTTKASTTSDGLMSKEDKAKLDGLSPKEQLFIDMWNSACGTNGKYNTETGFYELNGLTDITYEQALTIYNEKFTFTKYMDGSLGNNLSRTNLSNGLSAGAQSGGLTLKHFGANSKYEVFNFGWAEIYNGSQIFRNNIRLKKIMNAWFFSGIDPQTIAFASSNLESLLIKLGGNINLSNLAKLTYETFDYIIKNSTNTTELTIKVHPTTYAYLQGTTPPTEQVGGTTEEWQALVTAATNKKISFATTS